jgi:hypothetical protein
MSGEVPKIPVLMWSEPGLITSEALDELGEVVMRMPGKGRQGESPFAEIHQVARLKKEEAVRRITVRALEDAEAIIERLQKFVEENKGDNDE